MQFIRKTTLERTEPPLHYHTCIQHRETDETYTRYELFLILFWEMSSLKVLYKGVYIKYIYKKENPYNYIKT